MASFSAATSWPGVDGTVDFGEGLDVGYRYYDALEWIYAWNVDNCLAEAS